VMKRMEEKETRGRSLISAAHSTQPQPLVSVFGVFSLFVFAALTEVRYTSCVKNAAFEAWKEG